MRKRSSPVLPLVAALVLAATAAAPASAQFAPLCPIDENGRVADVFYEGTVVFFEPIVEHERLQLSVSTPCGTIVKDFDKGEMPFFDIREVVGEVDGAYSWELRVVPVVDPSVRKALAEARESGDLQTPIELQNKGLLPSGPLVDSAGFTVERGEIIDPASGKEESSAKSTFAGAALSPSRANGDGFALASDELGTADAPLTSASAGVVLTNGDGVIRNSLCVGFDCPNSPTFSDTTILMMENNTRIKFDDTSSINSFPRNDWEIEANSNLNGGQSYIGFNDCGQSSQGGCATDLVFAVEAGVRQHALYVESDGDVGLGTQNPVVRLHAVDGDTPALRLEQDGSSGFEAQVWDVAGNETNFFVRDATNGSTLPFRIQPGAASNRVFIDDNDNVGIATTSPSGRLHIQDNVASPSQPTLLVTNGSGPPRLEQTNGAGGHTWRQTVTGTGEYNVDDILDGTVEFSLAQNGNLTISGNIITTNCPTGCGPDYVFEEGYELMTLAELEAYIDENGHLPNVPSAVEMETKGINMTQLQLSMLEKIEELTLYLLEQQQTIDGLRQEVASFKDGSEQ